MEKGPDFVAIQIHKSLADCQERSFEEEEKQDISRNWYIYIMLTVVPFYVRLRMTKNCDNGPAHGIMVFMLVRA